MKTVLLIIALILFSLTPFSTAQDLSPTEPRWKQLNQAYGFLLGQQASLDLIESNFPDLEKDARESRFAFRSSALGESQRGLESELASELGDNWPEIKKRMTSAMLEVAASQHPTREQAIAFLAEVKARGKGEMQDYIRATMLSVVPRFLDNPSLEIAEGWNQTFRTKGHPKSRGVDVSISFPASWVHREGFRPHIVQIFQSGAGHGSILCNIQIRDLNIPAGTSLTKQDIKEFFQASELKKMLPEGSVFVEGKRVVLDGSPAGMIVSDQTLERLDFTVSTRMTQFVMIQDESMVSAQFFVWKSPDSDESLDELQAKYLSTYRAIANTIVLNDQYE